MSRHPSIRHASGSPRPARGLLPLAALACGPALILTLLVTSPPRAHAASRPPTGPASVSPSSAARTPAAGEQSAVRDEGIIDGCPDAHGLAATESEEGHSRRHLLGEVGPGAVPANCTELRGSSTQGTRHDVHISTGRDNGPAPLTVAFSGAGRGDGAAARNTRHVAYAWDFDGDGSTDSTAVNPSHTYRGNGSHSARLTVTWSDGITTRAARKITVGNSRPVVSIEQPLDHSAFGIGDTLSLTVGVADTEDGRSGAVDCSRVVVESPLGRVPALRRTGGRSGCAGTLVTGREVAGDVVYGLTARYEDDGAPGAPALTGSASVTLRAAFCEAEWFTATGGTHGGAAAESRSGDSGGRRAAEIEDGDWIGLGTASLTNIGSMTVRAASGGIGGTLELRSGSPAGPLLGEVAIPFTGGWDRPVSPTFALSDPGHGVRLFAVFSNPAWSADTADLFALDWLRFNGPGAGGSPREPDVPGAPDGRR